MLKQAVLRYLLPLFLLAGWGTLAAQFSLGVTAGITATGFRWPSDIRTSPQSDPKTRYGLTGGISIEYTLSKTAAIHTDLLFQQEGGKLVSTAEDAEFGATTYETSVSLNYLEVPVLFRMYSNGPGARLYAGLGAAVSYGLFGRDEISINYSKDGVGQVTDIGLRDVRFNDVYKQWDAAVVLEGGLCLETGPGELNGGIRLSHGLGSIIRNPASQQSALNNLVNRGLAFVLGYRIYLY